MNLAHLSTEPWTWFWIVDVVALVAVLVVRTVLINTLVIRRSTTDQSPSIAIAWVMVTAIAAGFFAIANNGPLQKANSADAALGVALGLFALGILIGFLFALPKVTDATPVHSDNPALPARLRANTNLEKVSDWLTTVITGLALTQLTSIPGYIHTFTNLLAGDLSGTAASPASLATLGATALGIAIEFPIVGFLAGYIGTRTVLTSAFEDAERELFGDNDRAVVDKQPKLFQVPDQSSDTRPSDDELAAARQIASANTQTLTTADQWATYARALTILDRPKEALPWYVRALDVTPNDARLLEQYATALYRQSSDEPPALQMVKVLKHALELVKTDATARARISTNLVLTYLYVPDGFMKSLTIANDMDRDATLEKRPILYYYRACANGQLYRALLSGRKFPAASHIPNNIVAVNDAIRADTDLAIRLQPALRSRFQNVIEPKPADPNRDEPNDDDLATFAANHKDYAEAIKATPSAAPDTKSS